MSVEQLNSFPKLKILWFIDLDYKSGMRHGGTLRFFNFSTELVSRGHEVYFLVNKKKTDDLIEKRQYLNDLKEEKVITDYFETDYQHPKLRGKLAHIIGHPTAVNRLLRKYQEPTKTTVDEIITSKGINLCIFNDRDLLFVLPEIQGNINTIIDWIDCYVLYWMRAIIASWKRRELTQIPQLLRYLVETFIQERYYGRRCAANIVVSPVDKKYLDFVNRVRWKNKVLLNGVRTDGAGKNSHKIKNRIIFTGNMYFPPNYEAANWFIDHVLPLLLKRKSDIKLVIAGANPVKELLSRASDNIEVTGYVADMGQEIAKSALYVAPLISGGGFKNKVVEAITSGTFVVATSLAVEFLSSSIQQQLLIADTPEKMADHILSYLDDPQKFETRLETLKKIIDEEFQWGNRTEELINIAYELHPENERKILSCAGETPNITADETRIFNDKVKVG